MNDFDIAAEAAEAELTDDLNDFTGVELAAWFAAHYRTAGHKRLGRILVKRAKLAAKAVAA